MCTFYLQNVQCQDVTCYIQIDVVLYMLFTSKQYKCCHGTSQPHTLLCGYSCMVDTVEENLARLLQDCTL